MTTVSALNLDESNSPTEFEIIVSSKNQKYRLSGHVVNHDSFSLKIINEDYTLRWSSDFSANYIDDLTTKAGCIKRISVFWKMISNIAQGESQTASLEILTEREVQELRKNKNNKSHADDEDNKLYVILTQTSEYDRFRYPLAIPLVPFSYEEYAQTIKMLYCDNAQLHKSLIAADCTQTMISLENKVADFAAMFAEMKRMKNEKIKSLKKKLKAAQAKLKELPNIAAIALRPKK